MRNLTSGISFGKLRLLLALVALASLSTLGACKKAKEVLVDAIGAEGDKQAGAAAPAEAPSPAVIAQQDSDPLVRKNFQQEVQGGDAGPAAAAAPTATQRSLAPAPKPTPT